MPLVWGQVGVRKGFPEEVTCFMYSVLGMEGT